MDDPRVVQPLHDPHVLSLRTRRAHACVNSVCAALARVHFALPRLYVSRDDCEHENAEFVIRKLMISNPKLLLCAKGETAYPEMRLDTRYWRHRNQAIVLDGLQYTAAYFLGRVLAPTSQVRFKVADVFIHATSIRVYPSGVDAQMRDRGLKQVGLHAVLSAFHEHSALFKILGRVTSALTHTYVDNSTEVNLCDMRMDSATVRAVGSRLVEQDRQELLSLNLSNTTAWTNEDARGNMAEAAGMSNLVQQMRYEKSFCNYTFAGTEHAFVALKSLNVSSNPLGNRGADALGYALMCNRFPKLVALYMHDTQLDADAIRGPLGLAFGQLRNQLKGLHLSHNHFGYLGLCSLMTCTMNAKQLACVDVSDTECPDWAYERLGNRLGDGDMWPAINTLIIKSPHAPALEKARAQHIVDLAIRKMKACRDFEEFKDKCASDGLLIGQPPHTRA